MNLLIVEDNAEMRRLLKFLLQEMADVITECADGAQALAAYESCRPDLVVMDMQMPVLDGISATKEILRAYPEARILILTDYNDKDLRQAAQAAGARGYFLKENLLQLPEAIVAHS